MGRRVEDTRAVPPSQRGGGDPPGPEGGWRGLGEGSASTPGSYEEVSGGEDHTEPLRQWEGSLTGGQPPLHQTGLGSDG